MVRRKMEIKPIEDKAKRHTTFTKRRQGLFKKAGELCKRCNAEAAVIAFSLAGNAFAFGHPSVESVLNRYNSNVPQCSRGDGDGGDGEGGALPVRNAPRGNNAVVVNGGENDDNVSDDLKVDEMSMEELEELSLAMEEMKGRVIDRLNGITKTQNL